MSGTLLFKHDTFFKLGLLSREMQSLILSLLLQSMWLRKGSLERERRGADSRGRNVRRGKGTVQGSYVYCKKTKMWMRAVMIKEKGGGWRKWRSFVSKSVRSCNQWGNSREVEQKEKEGGRENRSKERKYKCKTEVRRWKHWMRGVMDWDEEWKGVTGKRELDIHRFFSLAIF